jgi:hypothetical protein
VQWGGRRGSCNQPHRGAENGEDCQQGAGRFDCSIDSRGQESRGKRVIETLARQTDRAFLAVGVVLDIQLVQHQTELADNQRNNKPQPAEPVSVSTESADHNAGGYPKSCGNGNSISGMAVFTVLQTDNLWGGTSCFGRKRDFSPDPEINILAAKEGSVPAIESPLFAASPTLDPMLHE